MSSYRRLEGVLDWSESCPPVFCLEKRSLTAGRCILVTKATGRTVADRRTATECWHIVIIKAPGTLLLPRSLFLISLNFNDTKVPVELGNEDALVGGVKGPVVELLHQLVLDNTEQLVGHLAYHMGHMRQNDPTLTLHT